MKQTTPGVKKGQKRKISIIFSLVWLFLITAAMIPSVMGASAVDIGSASNFAILAKSGITNTGTTQITGNIGVSPIAASSMTGFGLIMDPSNQFSTSSWVNGRVYAADYDSPTPSMMTSSIGDMEAAYTDAVGRVPTVTDLGAGDIGGMNLIPGVYRWNTVVTISDDVTLSGGPDDIWIFQVTGTLGISSGKHVILSGGAQAKNIFWVVAGQTTLGTNSDFSGNILDQTGIALQTGAILNGRALAQTAVTLDSNTVNGPIIPVTTTPTTVPTTPVTTTPTMEPTTTVTTTPTTEPTTTVTTTPTTEPTTTVTTTPTTEPTTTVTTTPTTEPTTTVTTTPTTEPTTTVTTTATSTTTSTITPTITVTPTATGTTTSTTTPTITVTPTAIGTPTPTTTSTSTATPTATGTPTPTTTSTSAVTPTATGTTIPTTGTTTAVSTQSAAPTQTPPPLVKPTGTPMVITQPIVITQPGYYQIDRDVDNTTTPVYIDIRTSDVIIDGNGHTIDGVDGDNTHGIRVLGDGTLSGITIQNITIRDFAYGISLYNTTSSRIIWVNASSNTYDGIMIIGGGDNYLGYNTIHQDDDGINLNATSRTLVINNTITENLRGSGIHLSQGCLDVNMTGNLLGGNDEGFEIEDAVNTTIRHNRVSSSTYYGLNLTTAKNLTSVDNYFNNSANVNLPTDSISGTWNLPAVTGENIVGNNAIGGNYWGAPDGTGFSDITADDDGDGFADIPYILGGIGTDQLPLVQLRPLPVGITVMDALTNAEPATRETGPVSPGTTAFSSRFEKIYPIGSVFSR